MSKKSDHVHKFVPSGGWVGQCSNSNFSKRVEFSEMCGAMKLISRLPVNIDKGNSHRYHVTR